MINRNLLISGLFAASFLISPATANAQRAHKRNVQHQPSQPSQPQPSSHPTAVYELWYVDEEPHFPGGERGLLRYINSERQYPGDAYESGISGRVLCSFTIDQDGVVGDVRVIRSVEASLDREAIRIITNMPRWRPAHVANTPVPVNYVLPIPFRL